MTDIRKLAEQCRYYVNDEKLARFAALVRQDALEEAARVCEEIEIDRWDAYKGRGRHPMHGPERADPDVAGQSTGAARCADAIRAIAREGVK